MDVAQRVDLDDLLDDSWKLRAVFPDGARWVPHGRYMGVGTEGRVSVEVTYRRGVAHGPYVDYWASGSVSLEGQYENGQKEGVWHSYNKDGSLREIVRYEMGKEIPAKTNGGSVETA